MIEIIDTIKLKKTLEHGYIVMPESQELIKNRNDDIILVEVKESKTRSLQQLRNYWKVWLPCFCSNVDGMEIYVTDNGKYKNYDIAHRFMTLRWAMDKNHIDLIKTIPVLQDGKITKAATVNLNFNDCSQKMANDYFDFIQSIFNKKVGVSMEEMIQQEMQNVS